MICSGSVSHRHCWESPFPNQNLKHCPRCDTWIIAARDKIVYLPPPAALADSAPFVDHDLALGHLLFFRHRFKMA